MSTENPAPCVFLPWDSEFFGCRIGRVQGDTLDEDLAVSVYAWAIANSVRALYFLARSDDTATVQTAERHGYGLVDVRMTFEHPRRPGETTLLKAPPNGTVRPVRPDDVPTLQEIARTSHDGTRFTNDQHFPRQRAQDLYATWIALECQGRAQQVLVAASQDDAPLGYVSCHLGSTGSGEIGLVGVNQNFRGNGLGSRLVSAALLWFDQQDAPYVTVVTQGNNKAAQRLYQKFGFLTKDVQLWYHRWFAGTGETR